MMYRSYAGVAERATITGQVFGLLGFSLLFTAGGAVLAPQIGPAAFFLSLVGSLGCLVALWFLKEKTPINLGLFYLFSVCEGLLLGLVVESYLARGLGVVVANAAAVTAALVLGLGAYAWTTKRDLSGLSGFLTIALFGVLAAMLVNLLLGLFGLHVPAFSLLISLAVAVLFSLFLMVDLQRVRGASGTQGDAIVLAIAIYLDVFNLFLSLLQILGFLSSRDE
jgi:modulator of FtsH protease